MPTALQPGSPGSPDADGIFTGSVIRADGQFHAFYTGFRVDSTIPCLICHAVSDDLVEFRKDPEMLLAPDQTTYGEVNWRDPFVFWNEEASEYWMLIAAKLRKGPRGSNGAVGLATSRDLITWRVQDPIYAPGNVFCPECPEVFRLGDRWRLVYSEFRGPTVYRDAFDLQGPWRTPTVDRWDGPLNWKAAKSLADDRGRRISFGWVRDRGGFSDRGPWLYGGDMSLPRELYVLGDGDIGIRSVHEFIDSLTPGEVALRAIHGDWVIEAQTARADAIAGIAVLSIEAEWTDSPVVIDCTIRPHDVKGSVGMVLSASEDLNSGLGLIIRPSQNRAELVPWPFITEGKPPNWRFRATSGEPIVHHWLPLSDAEPIEVRCIRRGTVFELFVNDRVAFTHRLYKSGSVPFGLLVQDGSAEFSVRVGWYRPQAPQ